ncbi:tetratricopeptide repeat protein [Halomicronema sp. CCY15110]|uniref:tetratricopeptide repeat protein n=1 Tax=Halomicronema sp. CCY15110 TaxID=2767773 RepID=UPI0019516F46|nr:tetratricopeptide repeat protein [Halomicronema sp. CCY15110]
MTETEQRERAARKLAEYRLQFSDYGDNAMRLAQHAALPVALTPELLHLIRINFFLDPPEENNGNWQPLPYWIEFDFLVSSLCEKVDEGLYEIEPAVRNCLLEDLVKTYKNTDRVNEIATLLWQYTVHHSGWENRVGLERAQQLTALTFLAPNQASEWLEHAEAEAAKGKGVEREWYVIMRQGIEKQQRMILETKTPEEERFSDFDLAYDEEVLRQIDHNNELAESQVSEGNLAGAIVYYKEALKLQERLLEDAHPDIVITLNNLANLYQRQERYSEAEPLYQQALTICQRQWGEQHFYVTESLSNLANLYRDQERYGEAEPLYQQALAIRQRQWGEQHLDVAESLSNLANLYCDQERYSEAEPLYQQALLIRQQLYEGESPDVAESLNDLAILYHNQEHYSDAEPLYQEALEMRRRLLGDESPDVAESLNRLATLYRDQERYSQAEPLYQEALAMRQRLLGNEHPYIAKSLSNLATLYLAQRRYEEAESLYLEALAMRRSLFGEENRYTAKSLSNLATLYFTQGRYEEAGPLYREALDIRQRLLGANHPEVVENAKLLEELYRRQGINTYETGSWTQEDLAVYEEEIVRNSNRDSAQSQPDSASSPTRDFFISYVASDRPWAKWIAWCLEEEGYSVFIDIKGFRPGSNFLQEVQRIQCERSLVVLSEAYSRASSANPEILAAFSGSLQANERKLIPVRVEDCKPTGFLRTLIYVDLVDSSEVEAKKQLLSAIGSRDRMRSRPSFPDENSSEERIQLNKPKFPGRRTKRINWQIVIDYTLENTFDHGRFVDSIVDQIRQLSKDRSLEEVDRSCKNGSTYLTFKGGESGFRTIETLFRSNELTEINGIPIEQVKALSEISKVNLTPRERLALSRKITSLTIQDFNDLLILLNPPAGLIPSPSASQGDRVYALLTWAESTTGPGLGTIQDALNEVLSRNENEIVPGEYDFMQLSKSQRREIYEVLLNSFDQSSLSRMVSFELNEALPNIAGGSDFSEIVFNLIRWAERTGRLESLMRGALAENSNNPQLAEVARRLGFDLENLTQSAEDNPTQSSNIPIDNQNETSQSNKEVFISYAWGGDSEAIVNQLDQAFQNKGITLVRDKRDLGFKGRIKEFMQRIGRGKCVVAVISEKYLKSENCMYELVQIAKNGTFYDRIFPIVLGDANIYKPVQRIKYIQYWEDQIDELNEAMRTVNAANLQGFRDDIDLYTEIRGTISGLIDILKDMNTLTPEMHRESDFDELFKAVEQKLAE